MKIDPSEITIGKRRRHDVDDGIGELCESIRQIGQIVPITLDMEFRLVCGARRLRACQLLGIEVRYELTNCFDDAVKRLLAERDENTCRLPHTPSEDVEIGLALEEMLKPEAEKRKSPGVNQHTKEVAGNLPATSSPQVRDQVASAVGMSGRTYDKVKAVVQNGSKELVQAMDTKQVSIDTAAKMTKLPEEKQKQVLQESATAKNPRKAAAKAVEQIQMPPERPHVDDCIKFRAMFDKLYSRWSSDEAKQVMRQFFRQLANEV